jgi:hypothetical protein
MPANMLRVLYSYHKNESVTALTAIYIDLETETCSVSCTCPIVY